MAGIRSNSGKWEASGVGYLISTNWCSCRMEKTELALHQENVSLLKSVASSRLPRQKDCNGKSEFLHVRNPNSPAGLRNQQWAQLPVDLRFVPQSRCVFCA